MKMNDVITLCGIAFLGFAVYTAPSWRSGAAVLIGFILFIGSRQADSADGDDS